MEEMLIFYVKETGIKMHGIGHFDFIDVLLRCDHSKMLSDNAIRECSCVRN